ncbi:MAG: AgmX/PglI C-terminal domain-containing protein [Myxococcales bacterium]|nr:TonB family protein [Myxococcota bacterium]MDW8280731.1 AgmX/PglI C-terminal domain-containing protein [Myxococcales bacterium]
MSRADAERDAPQQVKKILRVGLFQGGKSLEERLFRKPTNVTLGQSTRNTFVVPASAVLPKSFTLFEHGQGGYALNFTDSMEGRLSLGEAVLDLSQLRQGKAQRQGELWHVMLNDRARGKIVIGDLTVLFQFVTPPPVQPRPQLPPSVRGSILGRVDTRLALVMMGSFLAHFGFVVYLRTLDFPRQQDIEEIPDRFVQLMPRKVEPPKQEEAPREEREQPKKEEAKKEAKKEPAQPVKKEISAEEQARLAAERRARLEQQVSQLGLLKMLTAKGEGGTVVDLVKGGDPGADADKVFSQIGGVGVATGGGLQAVKGGGGVGLSRGIDGLRASGPGDVGTGDKGEARVRAVVRDSAPQDIEPGTLDPSAVAAKIRQYKGALVACYESALKRNPNLSGKITLRFTINRMGKVSKAEIETDTMHDEDVNRCIIERASNWRFPPPEGGGEEVQFAYPFIFQAAK